MVVQGILLLLRASISLSLESNFYDVLLNSVWFVLLFVFLPQMCSIVLKP